MIQVNDTIKEADDNGWTYVLWSFVLGKGELDTLLVIEMNDIPSDFFPSLCRPGESDKDSTLMTSTVFHRNWTYKMNTGFWTRTNIWLEEWSFRQLLFFFFGRVLQEDWNMYSFSVRKYRYICSQRSFKHSFKFISSKSSSLHSFCNYATYYMDILRLEVC